MEKFNLSIKPSKENDIKELIIHTTSGIAYYFFPKALFIFKKKFPSIIIELLAGPEYFSSLSQNADLFVGQYQYSRRDLTHTLLKEFQYSFYASKNYLKGKKKIESLKDLKGHNFIIFSDDHSISTEILSSAHSIIKSNSYPTLYKMCSEGLGICSFPPSVCNAYENNNLDESKNLVKIIPEFDSENSQIYFEYSKFSYKEKIIRELYSIMKLVMDK